MSKLLKPRSNLTSHQVSCAYCHHQRTFKMMESEFPPEGEEHIWCTKCHRTFKYDRGLDVAFKLEDIKMKGEHGNNS